MKAYGLLVAFVLLAAPSLAADTAGKLMHYDLHVTVAPERHGLEATAVIRNPLSNAFYLHKGLAVRSVTADGRPATFHAVPGPMQYAPESVRIAVDGPAAARLEVTYAGTIDKPVSGVNMLSPELVELALYSAWYPAFPGAQNYTFAMTADLPRGMTAVSNGKRVSRQAAGDRTVFAWQSFAPGYDMVLLAAPGLRASVAASPYGPIEIDYRDLPVRFVEAHRDALAEAQRKLIALFGAPQAVAGVRQVFSPRSGWAYSRFPMIVTPEDAVRRALKKADGAALLFNGSAHELSHHWWMIASAYTPDDWINEGLAEFMAFRLTKERFGDAAVARILASYTKHAAHSETSAAIAETEADSPDRYLNRYERTTLMFLEAEARFGRKPLDAFLRALYTRFKGTTDATTEAFLALAADKMGPQAAAFFRAALYRHPEPHAQTSAG